MRTLSYICTRLEPLYYPHPLLYSARKNDYMADMRYFILIISLICASLLGAILWIAPEEFTSGSSSLSFGEAQIGGDFTLTDQHKKPFAASQLKGHYSLVYFGYTHCPDICPTSLLIISHALEALGKDANLVLPVFISLDPERDTPEILSQYVQNFDPRLIGLTGTPSQVKQAADAYKVYFSKVEQKDSALGYLVDHSGYIYLMGPDGKYLAHFPYNVAEQTIISTLRTFIKPL